MKFPYVRYRSDGGAADVWRPVAPVLLKGPLGSAELEMLVDSGADETVLPLELLEAIGIETREADVVLAGAGGEIGDVQRAEVELEIGDLRFVSRVVAVREQFGPFFVLGHRDLFDLHFVSFDARNRIFTIARPRT